MEFPDFWAGFSMLSSDLSEVVLERFWGFSGFCLSNFSSISLSFAAVSTGLAPPKIELYGGETKVQFNS